MAFRRRILLDIGGFDPSFGPFSEGTMSRWPARATALFIVASVDFNDYFTRKVRKDISAHLADTKTQTALAVFSIRSLGLGKNCGVSSDPW